MTVLTMPVEPAPPAPGGPPPPVPWRRMAWVTWCQHRPALVTVAALSVALAVFMVIAGLKFHHDYVALFACRPAGSAACRNLSSSVSSNDWHIGDAVNILLQLGPALVGAFIGVPVLARELETGTFRYAWTQGIGRERWTIAKLALLGIVFAVGAGVLGQLFSWFFQPFVRQQNMTPVSAAAFDTHGIAFAAWTLAGFTMGAFLGMLIRRIVPAMVATLGAYTGLDLLTWQYLRPHYPVSGLWPTQFVEASWLLPLSVLLVAATVWLARHRAA
jgi:ABC-type transport system involved in multi-copper enzyme maturation permease subunit